MTSTSDRPSLPNLPTELAALDSGMRASVTRYAMRAVSEALAAPVAQAAAGALARDFPPMGGLTECDMGDSDE